MFFTLASQRAIPNTLESSPSAPLVTPTPVANDRDADDEADGGSFKLARASLFSLRAPSTG